MKGVDADGSVDGGRERGSGISLMSGPLNVSVSRSPRTEEHPLVTAGAPRVGHALSHARVTP